MTRPLCLGIEIGGTKLQLGLGHGDGQLLALERRRIDPSRGAAGIRDAILASIVPLTQSADVPPSAIQAAAVGFGGPVDAKRGTVTKSHQVDGWDDFPFADWVGRNLEIDQVVIQNDADTAGLAEALFGAGVGLSPILYVTIGSGIGGGLIVDGQIYRGSGSGAVEIGHLWVPTGSETERGPDLLENLASGWAIAREARQLAGGHPNWDVVRLAGGDAGAVTTEHVAASASQGDPLALQILDRAAEALARGLGHAVTLLAPRRVILGGGVSLMPDRLWLGPVRERLARYVFPPFRGTFELVAATLGEEVVVHGALALARSRWVETGS